MSLLDTIGFFVSLLLTAMVFSYLLGENPVSRPLYRIALHVFIGAAAGYALVVVAWYVLWPQLLTPLTGMIAGLIGGRPPALDPAALAVWLVPYVFGLLLLFKLFRSGLSQLGNIPVAYLVGVGAAVAVGGAVTGTLFPQVRAAAAVSGVPLAGLLDLERLVDAVVFFVGTTTVLMFFFFAARRGPAGPERPAALKPIAVVGEVFINIAYGALFAGALAASLAVLSDRFAFIREAIGRFGF